MPRSAALMLLCLALLLPALLAPAALGQQKQFRDRSGPTKLDADTVRDLQDHWNRHRNPTVVLVMAIENNGQLVTDARSSLLNRLGSPIREELRRAFRDGFQRPDFTGAADQAAMALLNRQAGGALPKEALDLLKEAHDADLIIEVVLLSGAPRGGYTVSMNVIDSRDGVEIASRALRGEVSAQATVHDARRYGVAVVRAFAEEFLNFQADRARTYNFKLLSQQGTEGLDGRSLRRLTRDIEDLDGVAWAEAETIQLDGSRYVDMKIRYDGDDLDLLDDIDFKVLEERGLAWSMQQEIDDTFVAFVFANTTPAWYELTDPSADRFSELIRKRQARLLNQGKPTLGVVIGEDLQEPIAAFSAGTEQPRTTFDMQTLQGELENRFADLGFDIVEPTQLRRQLRQQLNNAGRYENLPHLIDAMRDFEAVDMVLHVNVLTPPDGSTPQLNARLFDVAKAEFVGFQRFPDASVNPLKRFAVDADDPEQLSRYLAGQLVERWDRWAEDRYSTLSVQVRNLTDAQEVLAIVDLLTEAVPAIQDTADLQIAAPVGSFEVVYADDVFDVLMPAMDALGGQYPGTEVRMYAGAMVINLDPSYRPEDEVPDPIDVPVSGPGQTQPTPTTPDTPDTPDTPGTPGTPDDPRPINDPGTPAAPTPATPTPPAPANPVAPSPMIAANGGDGALVEHLRQHKASVWLIFAEGQGSGTAWTVRPGLLATNAHVAEMLPSARRNKRDAVIAAVKNNDLEQGLKLGRVWIHPQYDRQRSYDVALIEVLDGEAGTPLPLATAEQIDRLDTPIRVGYVGFPGEGVRSGDKLQFQQAAMGYITGLVDFDYGATTATRERIVTHNLLASAGASGSPIFGTDGRVVALHNAGAFIDARVDAGRKTDRATGAALQSASIRVKSAYKYGITVDILQDFMADLERAGEIPAAGTP